MSLEGKKPESPVEGEGKLPRKDTVEISSDVLATSNSVAHLRLVADNTRSKTEHGIGAVAVAKPKPEKRQPTAKKMVTIDDSPVVPPKRPLVQKYPKTLTGLEAPEAGAPEDKDFSTRLAEVRKTGEEIIESSRPSLRNPAVPKDLMFNIEDEPTNEMEDEPTLPGKFVPKAIPRLQTSAELFQSMVDEKLIPPPKDEKPQFNVPKFFDLTEENDDENPTLPGVRHQILKNSDSNIHYLDPDDREVPRVLPGPIAKPQKEALVVTSKWQKARAWLGAAAIGFLAVIGVGKLIQSDNAKESLAPIASASNGVRPVESVAPMPSVKDQVAPMPVVKKPILNNPKVDQPVKEVKAAETIPARTAHAVKILKMSENKVLKSTLENGEFIVQADSSILDSILMPYMSRGDEEQKAKIKQLERDVQLGLTMYMYDKFGTPEKLEASLKDPELRNLYKTVKTWNLSNVENRLPAVDVVRMKELARRIMEDAKGLGHDKAEKAERAAVINGNIFNARGIGDVVKMRFADGRKHVLLEKMDEIFYGGISQIMDKAPAVAKPTVAPAAAKNGSTQDKFLPNIAEDLEAIDAGWDDLLNQAGSDEKVEKLDVQKNELEEIDAGWDEVEEKQSPQLIDEKAEFQKNGTVKFELPKGLTTREENNLLLPELMKKVKELMPEADQKVVERVMKQFEFRAIKRQVKNGRFVEMELNSRFREILRYELNKGKIGV